MKLLASIIIGSDHYIKKRGYREERKHFAVLDKVRCNWYSMMLFILIGTINNKTLNGGWLCLDNFVCQKALLPVFKLQNNLCAFTTCTTKFKIWICNDYWSTGFDFWFLKLSDVQISIRLIKNCLPSQNEFSTLNK